MIYIYIYGLTFGNAECCVFLFAAQCFNTESIAEGFPVSQLCVNTLPATKVTLISHECISVVSLESVLCSSVLHLVNGMECWVIKLCYFSNGG